EDGGDQPERPVDIRLELVLDVIDGHLLERTPDLEAGVVDEHVNVPGLIERAANGGAIAYVQGDDGEVPAVRLGVLREVPAFFGRTHRCQHAIAFGGEHLGGGATDSGRCSS